MSLWEYANPKKFMETSGAVLPGLAALTVVSLVVGLVWGFFFTPDDFRQGSTVKIVYLHVPAAMMAINAWVMMLVASLVWLIRRHHVSALAARAAAPLGLTFTLIALVTGALWPVVADRQEAFWIDFVAGYGTAAQVPATVKQTALMMIGEMYDARTMGAEQPTGDAFKYMLAASRSARGLF